LLIYWLVISVLWLWPFLWYANWLWLSKIANLC
jgi:hypothetical protein